MSSITEQLDKQKNAAEAAERQIAEIAEENPNANRDPEFPYPSPDPDPDPDPDPNPNPGWRRTPARRSL